MQNNTQLTIKPFCYIQIENDAKNIREIMLFVGIKENDIEQELIFHDGGDTFLINSQDVYSHQGNYIVKVDGRIEIIPRYYFELLLSKNI